LKTLVECRTLYHDEVMECVEEALQEMKAVSLEVDHEGEGALSVVSGFVTRGRIRFKLRVLVETTERVVEELPRWGRIRVSYVSAEVRCRDDRACPSAEENLLRELSSGISSHLMSKRAGG
jgi:hypothetical protein